MLVLWLMAACSTFDDGYQDGCPWGDADGCYEGTVDGGLCLDDEAEPYLMTADGSYEEGLRAGYRTCYEAAYPDCYDEARDEMEAYFGDDYCDGG